jgi:nucleotide-binding universal stress UspA family protein
LAPLKQVKRASVKILLAADGSNHTKRAVNYVVKHRDLLGKNPELYLVHVRPPLPNRATAALGRSIVHRYYSDETRKALAAAKRILSQSRINFKETQLVGEPGEVIAAYAKKGRFSLIVLGSHGNSAFRNLVLGSVAAKVLANCKVPALIIR